MDSKHEAILNLEYIPSYEEFIVEIDHQLMRYIIDKEALLLTMFRFFDSDPDNPLTPRELLHFWESLTDAEKRAYAFEFC